jgi:hypothetical protein
MRLTQSKEVLGVFRFLTGISVRFAATAPFELQIKHAMKTSAPVQNKPILPSLFQIAARVENFTSARTPFNDLMLHPDKLAAALKNAKSENDAFEATRKFSRIPRATRSATDSHPFGGASVVREAA